MIKKLLMILTVLAFSVSAHAAPFLTCDAPDPTAQVISYIVYKDGVEYATPAAETDGSLKLDLAGETPGQYEWSAIAVNVWGQSELSDPYISPSLATKPRATRMVP